MKKIYNDIFCKLEKNLNSDYINNSNLLTKNIFEIYYLNNNFCNERSLAYYTSNFFEKTLLPHVTDFALINEATFTIKKTISQKIRKKHLGDVDNLAKKEYKKTLEPDAVAFFKYNNVDYKYFIEYKVHSHYFKYIELANDYLKYKIYTSHNKNSSAFIYVIFNVNANRMPTLLNGINKIPQIQFLNEKITKSDIDKNSNIFIYDPKMNESNEEKPKLLDKHFGPKEIDVLDRVVENAKKLVKENLDIDFNDIPNYIDNVFVKNISCLGTNVSTAQILHTYYDSIEKLFKLLEINNENLLNQLAKIERIENPDSDFLFKWLQNYFRNFVNFIFGKEKDTYNKVLINGSTRKSLIILIMIDKFCKDNGIHWFKLDLKNRDEQRDFEKIKKTEFYSDYYNYIHTKAKYDLLVKVIIFYLYNLYIVIYDLNLGQVNHGLLEYNKKYKCYLAKKSIIDNLSAIKSLCGINRGQKLGWDFDINEFGKSLLEIVANNDYGENNIENELIL